VSGSGPAIAILQESGHTAHYRSVKYRSGPVYGNFDHQLRLFRLRESITMIALV
jgi:hypothetical protein